MTSSEENLRHYRPCSLVDAHLVTLLSSRVLELDFSGFNPVAGWSSLAARRAHNPKVVGSNPAPATNLLFKNSNSRCVWVPRVVGRLRGVGGSSPGPWVLKKTAGRAALRRSFGL